jgi:iron complex transport system ATP-binding protein
VIDVDGVHVSLGGLDVLEDVSLTVETGEFVGLVGPNGAGKTTLLRTVNGAIQPDDGCVRVDGDRIGELSSRAGSRRVATVPQDTGTRFAFSVEDVVAMGRTPHRDRFGPGHDAQGVIDDALERTSTTSLRDRRISTLSGGERQRVFVARAIAQATPALVLDEPTASLDVNHAARTLSLVCDLVDDGRAILGAIHDLEAAARFCDRLCLLSDGQIVAAGAPTEVLTTEALATTFDVESAVTQNPVTGTPTVTPLPETQNGGESVHVLGGGPVAATAVARLCTAGFEVTAGPVPAGDALLETTAQFDVPTETVAPLSSPDDGALETTRNRIDAADVTVLADLALTPGQTRLDLAAGADRLLVVDEQSLDDRNHGDEVVRRRYERLRQRAAACSVEDVASAVPSVEEQPVERVSRRGI